MHRLGRRPPTEAEAEYYARLHAESTPVTRNEVCMKPGMLQDNSSPIVGIRKDPCRRGSFISHLTRLLSPCDTGQNGSPWPPDTGLPVTPEPYRGVHVP